MTTLSFLRTRFGFLMVGLVLVVCLILLVRQRLSPPLSPELQPVEPIANVTPDAAPIDPTVLSQEWQRSVTEILGEYDRTADARAAKERLLTVRVPANGRDVHLALYLAFNALSESRPEGKTKLATARTTFTKIAPAPTAATNTPSMVASSGTRSNVTTTR